MRIGRDRSRIPDRRIGSPRVLNDDLCERCTWPAFARRFSARRKRHYRRNYWREFPHYHAYRFRNQHSRNLENAARSNAETASSDYASLVSSRKARSISRRRAATRRLDAVSFANWTSVKLRKPKPKSDEGERDSEPRRSEPIFKRRQ